MAIVSARHVKLSDGNHALAYMLGRRSSTELNAINYRGSSSWTAADTAWAATGGVADAVTVQLDIEGNTQTETITSPDTDATRMNRHFVLPALSPGIYSYKLSITSGASSIGDLICGFVIIAKTNAARPVVTGCFQSGSPAALLGEDIAVNWGTTDPNDNYVTSGTAPVNGSASPITRRMLEEQPTHWFHVDDAVYVALTQQSTNDEAPPLTLTDTLDDTPVNLYPMFNSNAGYTNSVLGASVDRNGTAAQQMIYLWYEYSYRRRDVFNACLQGMEYYRVIGDNDIFNDFDMSYWSLLFNPASGGARFDGMTTPSGDPYLTATHNPADFTNATNRTNQIEANTYWRLLRSVWDIYVTPYSPPSITSTPQVPWVVRELQNSAGPDPDYDVNDYIPFHWKYDLDSHSSVIAWDFTTCQDLNVITTESSLNPVDNNYIRLNGAGTHWLDGSGNNLRVVESPLGDANDSTLKAQLATQQSAGRNVMLLLPKEMGSLGRGNRDGLWRRNVNWVVDLHNTTFAGLSRPVLVFSGDWHTPTGIKNGKCLQIGISPSSPLGLSAKPTTGNPWSSLTVNITGVTDTLINITEEPSWTLDETTTGADAYRMSYGAAVLSSGSMYAYAVDQRGGKVVDVYRISSTITLAGGSLPLTGVFNMAKDRLRAPTGRAQNFSGIGIFAAGTAQRAGGSVYHPLQKSDGTVACIIIGAGNRNGGPVGNHGPAFAVLVGHGDITASPSTIAEVVAELPADMTITNGGYTFTPSTDATNYDDSTVDGVMFRTIRMTGGGASEYFGGSKTALDPVVTDWTALQAGISIGDRRLSTDPDVELKAATAGTAGTIEPPVDGIYGSTVSDGTLSWEQVLSSEPIEFDVVWTDPTAASSGGGAPTIIQNDGIIIQ